MNHVNSEKCILAGSQGGKEVTKLYASNPVITSIYTADPSAHVWEDGRIYMYPSRDMDPPRGCDLMDHYHVFSSEDMVNWVDEGEILSSGEVSWGRPEGGFMWAPDCAYKNGTYYFYFPHPTGEWNKTWKVGVATSHKPASGFKDIGYIEGLGGFAMIDPCVFVDEDGRAYMYYGGGARCQGGELNGDMISLKDEMADMEGLVDFHEATWVFKRKGIYYLTYADNDHGANKMRYAISKNPLGPWEYKGVFLEATGCDTTHGSVVEYKGQWYLFYHNQAISGRGNLRTVCIDYLYFNEDGTIKTVVQTKEGVKSAGEAPEVNPALRDYRLTECILGQGAVLESREDSGDQVIRINRAGAYLQLEHVDGGSGQRGVIKIYYTTKERLAKLNLTVNEKDYSLLNAPYTEGPDWGCTYITVRLRPGTANTIRLTGSVGDLTARGITTELLKDC